MKPTIPRFLFLLALAWAAGAPGSGCAPDSPPTATARPTRFIIGCSPFLAREHKDELYRRVVGFLLEDVDLGSSLHIYDAYHLKAVAQFDVPKATAFRSTRTRANQFRQQILEFKAFLAGDQEPPRTNHFDYSQAVRLPQFLEFVGRNKISVPTQTAILIVGSPLYLDDKEPDFSMVEGYFPSDGHLLASREQSVFGADETTPSLHGAVLHLVHEGDPWANDVHRTRVERFWSLYAGLREARLETLCGDLAVAFRTLREPAARTEDADRGEEPVPAPTKLEMLRVHRDAGVTDWITRDLSGMSVPDSPASLIGPMKIGIRWSAPIDLDLYARPRAQSSWLFFDNTRLAEGYYFKDHRSSPEREFEFVVFESPVDVRHVEAFVNFYEGRLPGAAEGEIRIEFAGGIYARQFAIASAQGNQGRRGPNQEAYWAVIDIPNILNLSPHRLADADSSRP